MKSKLYLPFIFSFFALLTSCGGGNAGPSKNELKNALHKHIASHNGGAAGQDAFIVKDLKIVSSENTGNSVNEHVIGRYTATLKTKDRLYREDEQLEDGTLVLVKGSKPGHTTNVYGTYEAYIDKVTSKKKLWDIDFDLNVEPESRWDGRPLAAYHNAVISGSNEEKQARKKVALTSKRYENLRSEFTDMLYTKIANGNGGEGAKDSFVVQNVRFKHNETKSKFLQSVIEGRFEGQLVTTQPLYKPRKKLSTGQQVVVKGSDIGLITKVSGRFRASSSTNDEGKEIWTTEIIGNNSYYNRWNGQPLAYFPGAVISGSQAEKDALKNIDIENKRLAALRSERLNLLAGTWVATSSILRADGTPYTDERSGQCVGITEARFDLEINPAKDDRASGKVYLYTKSKRDDAKQGGIRVTMSKDAETIKITFPKRLHGVCKNQKGHTVILLRTSGKTLEARFNSDSISLKGVLTMGRYNGPHSKPITQTLKKVK